MAQEVENLQVGSLEFKTKYDPQIKPIPPPKKYQENKTKTDQQY
jgi:hypothetical protein